MSDLRPLSIANTICVGKIHIKFVSVSFEQPKLRVNLFTIGKCHYRLEFSVEENNAWLVPLHETECNNNECIRAECNKCLECTSIIDLSHRTRRKAESQLNNNGQCKLDANEMREALMPRTRWVQRYAPIELDSQAKTEADKIETEAIQQDIDRFTYACRLANYIHSSTTQQPRRRRAALSTGIGTRFGNCEDGYGIVAALNAYWLDGDLDTIKAVYDAHKDTEDKIYTFLNACSKIIKESALSSKLRISLFAKNFLYPITRVRSDYVPILKDTVEETVFRLMLLFEGRIDIGDYDSLVQFVVDGNIRISAKLTTPVLGFDLFSSNDWAEVYRNRMAKISPETAFANIPPAAVKIYTPKVTLLCLEIVKYMKFAWATEDLIQPLKDCALGRI